MKFIVRRAVTLPIIAYQKTLSFDHGPFKALYPYGFCPYHPSCSEYCRQSIMKYGVARGLGKGVIRILRCHPWANGGIDRP